MKLKEPAVHSTIVSHLKDHFKGFYQFAAKCKVHPDTYCTAQKGITAAYSGIDYPFCNAIMIDEATDRLKKDLLPQAIQRMRQQNKAFVCYIDDTNVDVQPVLRELGLIQVGEIEGQSFLTHSLSPMPKIEGFDVQRVDSSSDLEAFLAILSPCFEFSNAAAQGYLQLMTSSIGMKLPRFEHYMGVFQGKPVSTLSLMIHEKYVSVWNGATLENYRKRGVCTYMAHACLQGMYEQGISMGFTFLMNTQANSIVQRFSGQLRQKLHTWVKAEEK